MARMSRPVKLAFGAVLAVFGVFYLVHAMAPEIQPDATTYHLGLVREWLRLGGFPARAGFYEMLPQGLEMLFTPAYAIGRHSAAKLVHFGFLVMTGLDRRRNRGVVRLLAGGRHHRHHRL